MIRTKLAAIAWLAIAAPAMAGPIEASIIQQMTCSQAPDPTEALLTLKGEGQIDSDTATLMDSATCWPLKDKLDIDGLIISDICASSEDPQMIKDYPDFFYRGPGTSAGTGLSLVSHDSLENVTAWAAAHFTGADPKYTVDTSSRIEDATELSCNSLNFPLSE